MPSSTIEVGASGLMNSAVVSSQPKLLTRLGRLSFLRASFEHLARGKQNKRSKGSRGSDDVTVAEFAQNVETEIRLIRIQLRAGQYHFAPLRPVAIPKKDRATFRPLLIPTVRDRVVQRGLLRLIAPHLNKYTVIPTSHAFQTGVGVKSAVHAVKSQLEAGSGFAVLVDIADFFSSIDTDRLFEEVTSILPDPTLLPLLKELQDWEIHDLASLPAQKRNCFPSAGSGIPQGSALSPALSNFFLRDVDREAQSLPFGYTRYADDIAMVCKSASEAEDAERWITGKLQGLGLNLNPVKRTVVSLADGEQHGVEYLGFFISMHGTHVVIKPSRRAIDNAKNEIVDCFSPVSSDPLSDRSQRFDHFIESWLGTYGHVCPVESQRIELFEVAQQELSALLTRHGLLAADAGLSDEQRTFLGLNSAFRRHRRHRSH